MKVIPAESIPLSEVTQEGASGCRIRELITAREGAPTFAMRQFEVASGGHTPFHSHPWEHEVFILEGTGHLDSQSGPRPFKTGDAILVPPDEQHSFCNDGAAPLKFLCLIPVEQRCCR